MRDLCKPKVKICGLTSEEEVAWVTEEQAEYAGFVIFFPKSKRNLSVSQAEKLLETLRREKAKSNSCYPCSVAVVVSPSPEQVVQIQELGFDFIQIHGTIGQDAVDMLKIPVIRAVNVKGPDTEKAGKEPAERVMVKQNIVTKIRASMEEEQELFQDKIVAWLFDAQKPGSGKVFDWEIFGLLKEEGITMILAGGLDCSNILTALREVSPDIVDVSSGVEFGEEKVGKDHNKIIEFIGKVRTNE